MAQVNPWARKVGDTMNTPHGNFRWSGTRWETIGYNPPQNASPPPAISAVTANTTNSYTLSPGIVTNLPLPPGNGGAGQIPPSGAGHKISMPPVQKTGMIKQPGQQPSFNGPTSNELESASVSSVQTQLWKQQMLLEELASGLTGDHSSAMDDAIYFVREAREALEKLSG